MSADVAMAIGIALGVGLTGAIFIIQDYCAAKVTRTVVEAATPDNILFVDASTVNVEAINAGVTVIAVMVPHGKTISDCVVRIPK